LGQPDGCPDVAYKQMLKCWNKDPKVRPTFNQLNHHFEISDEYASVAELMRPIRK